jgi:hypothetical protein
MGSRDSISASVMGRSSMVLKVPTSRTPYFLLVHFISSPKLSHFAESGVFLVILGSVVASDATCTCDIKSMIVMAKAEFNKKKTPFTSKLDLNLRKEPVKCYIWSMSLHGTETWTLRKVDQKCLESVEMWCW